MAVPSLGGSVKVRTRTISLCRSALNQLKEPEGGYTVVIGVEQDPQCQDRFSMKWGMGWSEERQSSSFPQGHERKSEMIKRRRDWGREKKMAANGINCQSDQRGCQLKRCEKWQIARSKIQSQSLIFSSLWPRPCARSLSRVTQKEN